MSLLNRLFLNIAFTISFMSIRFSGFYKLVVIVDVVDQNKALVDSPDVQRIQMNFKRLSLTDIVIEINRVPKKKALIEAMEKADVKNK
ncbi:unnamed protein product [Brassica oleracea var. botrytis]